MRRSYVTVAVVLILLTGCAKVAKSGLTAVELAARAEAKAGEVHAAVQAFNAPTARRGVAALKGWSDDATRAAQKEATPAARDAAVKTRRFARQAETETDTGWADAFRDAVKDEIKDQIRDAFRRAACDQARVMLANGLPPDANRYGAQVALYLRGQLADASLVTEVYHVARGYFDVLRRLDPRDPQDQAVLAYLAEVAYCPEAVASLRPTVMGWGIVLTQTAVTIVDSQNRPVGSIKPGESVQIRCTAKGFAVTGPYGTSDLWDFVGIGYVPDSYLYTGTNDPVASPC